MVRKAIYAGSFYDSDPNQLLKDFSKWFEQAKLPEQIGKAFGVISPHAGFIYSGPCAAHAYKLLSQTSFQTAVIIHPSHRGNHFRYSVSPYDEYITPLGNLKLDEVMADKIRQGGAEEIDAMYHQNEHSMEVQLPFLKYARPDAKAVPVMIGIQDLTTAEKLAENLSDLIDDNTVIIVSTDLSHYYDAKEAERLDRRFIADVLSGDPKQLYEDIRTGRCEACGFAGVLTLMLLSRTQSKAQISELIYTNSGEASGDFSQVVGYFAASFSKGEGSV